MDETGLFLSLERKVELFHGLKPLIFANLLYMVTLFVFLGRNFMYVSLSV